jgi:hypothetical protein
LVEEVVVGLVEVVVGLGVVAGWVVVVAMVVVDWEKTQAVFLVWEVLGWGWAVG